MAEQATRGDLAFALASAMGIDEPSSSGKFSDGGYLDGITSTLADIGVTNGIGDGIFGTMNNTTRGEAFAMIARAMGLATAESSIEEASMALVAAGIVQGYGGDPNSLGLNEPLQTDHLGLLMERISPEFAKVDESGLSGTDKIRQKVDDARDSALALKDPAYAAFMASTGVAKGEIDDEIKLRTELYDEDAKRRTETYGRAAEDAAGGIGQDFENRGLTRSGAHMMKQAKNDADSAYALGEAQTTAQRAHEESQRALARQSSEYQRAMDEARRASETAGAETEIEERI